MTVGKIKEHVQTRANRWTVLHIDGPIRTCRELLAVGTVPVTHAIRCVWMGAATHQRLLSGWGCLPTVGFYRVRLTFDILLLLLDWCAHTAGQCGPNNGPQCPSCVRFQKSGWGCRVVVGMKLEVSKSKSESGSESGSESNDCRGCGRRR